jgi:poly(A) polymerase
VTGNDVLGLGFAPGPLIGKILETVEEAQLNGELSSKEEAMSFVKSRFEGKTVALKKSERGPMN